MIRTLLIVFTACALFSGSTAAGDWPQWAGSNRDFSAADIVVPTPVLIGNTFYGSTQSVLVAVDAASGKHLWSRRDLPNASIVHAGGKLILLDENGRLTLATATKEGLTILSAGQVTGKYSLTAPALAGKTLFIRDRKRIVALDLG